MKYIYTVLAGLFLLSFSSALAATANVTVGPSGTLTFSPSTTTINAGDSVIWTWAGNNHNVTNLSALFGSPVQGAGATYTNKFNSAGSFPYECSIHVGFGMTGQINVTSVSTPPAISITNPPANTVFVAPASVTIQAAVTNGSGSVTNVQFRVGTSVLANVTAAPFSATTNNLAAGTYTLTAIATDNNALSATNSVIITVDSPPSITITNPAAGTVLAAPASVTVRASASDSDGSITNVQFLLGSTVLTNETLAPFSVTTNNLTTGSYTFSAIASDNLGIKNTNSVSISVVTPVPVSLTNSASSSGTNFQFSYAANVGLSYVVQVSTNLALNNWVSLITNVAASNPVVFVDAHATNSPAFYRVGRLPNP